jgi:hypothetical protein
MLPGYAGPRAMLPLHVRYWLVAFGVRPTALALSDSFAPANGSFRGTTSKIVAGRAVQGSWRSAPPPASGLVIAYAGRDIGFDHM